MSTTEIDVGPEPDRRIGVNFRVLPSAKARFEELAHKHSTPGSPVGISDVIRASLAVAAQHPAELDKTIIQIREKR